MNHDTHLRWIFNKSCNLSPNKMGQLSIFIMYDHPLYLKHTFRIIHNISRQLSKKGILRFIWPFTFFNQTSKKSFFSKNQQI